MFYTITRILRSSPVHYSSNFCEIVTDCRLNWNWTWSPYNSVISERRLLTLKISAVKQKAQTQPTRIRIFLWRLISSDNQLMSVTPDVTCHPGVKDAAVLFVIMLFSWVINYKLFAVSWIAQLSLITRATPVIYSCYSANGSSVSH